MKEELKYTKTHEWIKIEGEIGTVGITDFAQNQLGDIVYVDLPKTGTTVSKGKEVCTVESVKAASSIYSPVSGEIVEVNTELTSEPGLINQDPYGKGWIFKIKLTDKEISDLLDYKSYEEFVKSDQH